MTFDEYRAEQLRDPAYRFWHCVYAAPLWFARLLTRTRVLLRRGRLRA